MYLGIDCGTQGTKVVVLDVDRGQIIGQGYCAHPLVSNANGRREQEPRFWIDALLEAYGSAIDQAQVSPKAIRAIGVSGQQHGLVVLDRGGEVIRPAKLWCDTETEPQNSQLLEALGGEAGCRERLGLVLATGYTASKLLWLKQQEPECYARIAHILLPHDYLNYWLTGNCVSEYGDASGTGYFDIRNRCWVPEVLALIDDSGRLERALPPLLEAHQPAGTLRPEVADLLGMARDVLVSSGGGDNMMGAIGTGNIQPGQVTMSFGTSGTLYAAADQPITGLEPGVAPFCSSSGGWLPLICTMNLTNVTRATQQLLGLDLATLNSNLEETRPGAEGLLMLPFLNGERTPALPKARGSLLGIDMHNLTPANLCRASVEGTTFGLRYGLDLLRAGGIQSAVIRLVGGGSNSAPWRQIAADIMNTPVICPAIGEAAALGAAIQAAWCESHWRQAPLTLEALCNQSVVLDDSSRCDPDPARVARYEEAYGHYRAALRHHHGIG